VILVIFVLGLWLTGVLHRLDLLALPLIILGIAGAWLIFFNLHYCVGLLAFWIDGALALEPLLWYLYVILGGSIVPLDLFPAVIRDILHWLPFAYILDFPVQLMMGRLDGAGIWQGFLLQYGWVGALIVTRQLIWRAGLKRFSAAGA
jgi:ABC-2 type transport system permease protein